MKLLKLKRKKFQIKVEKIHKLLNIYSGGIFDYINKFKNNEGKLIKKKREIVIDDYLSYLVKNKLFKIKYFTLDDYMHIGSVTEYKEFNYWQRYFYEH